MSGLTTEFPTEFLKTLIETELKKDSDEDVGLKTAETILGVASIDKEYTALRARTTARQFTFISDRAGQKLRPYQIETLENLESLLKQELKTVAVHLHLKLDLTKLLKTG